MGMIINIDEALKLRTDYNVLGEPLNAMMREQQEAWERENPIDFLFVRGSLSTFQETYTSSIGFDHAFQETSDYTVGPIFNTAEGFAATYRTRTFQGGFIITQQVLEDRQFGRVKDDATAFVRRWNGDIVEYAMTAIDAGFGVVRDYNGTKLLLNSADTSDGDIMNTTKNPLFYKSHKTVKRDDGTTPKTQSNMFYSSLNILGSDPARISKLADIINQAITAMENYYDDNGKFAGVLGEKTIVCANDPQLKAALETALSLDMFRQGDAAMPNVAYKRAVLKSTPYLRDINACTTGTNGFSKGFFIVDKGYNAANHGPELTERVPFTLNAFEHKTAPLGISYEGRQRFDLNVASWRGIVYVALEASSTSTDWNYTGNFTAITPAATVAKEVKIVNPDSSPVPTKTIS